jgi:hypothetical protein
MEVNEPASHERQVSKDVALDTVENVPRLHNVHVADIVEDHDPELHIRQDAEAWLAYVPGEHSVHEAEAIEENVPAIQFRQVALDVAIIMEDQVPALQLLHAAAPAEE